MRVSDDQLPRMFQANIIRLFNRVIEPAMEALPIQPSLQQGTAASLPELLERARAQIDNHTANEAAKAFALTMAAVFERQLSIFYWARELGSGSDFPGYEACLKACAAASQISLGSDKLGDFLNELLLVANVVRHGEGKSCERLRAASPALWDSSAGDYVDTMPGLLIPSEHLRIGKNDLLRYIWATARFWGLADKLPGATVDVPYAFQ